MGRKSSTGRKTPQQKLDAYNSIKKSVAKQSANKPVAPMKRKGMKETKGRK